MSFFEQAFKGVGIVHAPAGANQLGIERKEGSLMLKSVVIAFVVLFAWRSVFADEFVLDESPAVEREWGYRPFDGSTPDQNPPGFSWRPTPDAAWYHLQISRDASFEKVDYEANRLPWSAHCPPTALKPGTLYWRYRAAGEKEGSTTQLTGWSTVRSFTLTRKAAVFPQPTSEMLKEMIPLDHPRLFLRPEDVAQVKARCEGDLKEIWTELVASADKLIEKPPDSTEPPLYPEGTVRLSEVWKNIWWGNRTRTVAVGNAASTLAFAYRIAGDEKYARAARELLMAFCEWDPNGATNYQYNDEAGMPALYLPARAYTFLGDFLTEQERSRVIEVMNIRGRHVFEYLTGNRHHWRPYASHSNRAWHKMGELAMAFYHDIPEASVWLDYAMTIFYTAYPVWGDSQGGWHEGTAYWSSYMSRFFYWADVMQSILKINIYDRPFYHQAGYYPLYVVPPGTGTGGFADQAILINSKSLAPVVMELAQGASNPYWLWYAESQGHRPSVSYLNLLRATRAQKLDARPPSDLPTSRLFEGVGLAAMNTNLVDGKENVQIHFKSSPFGRQSHGYNSNNAFLLNVRGEPVFIRSGKRDLYGSPHHREWMWETKSDNAILINGTGQITRLPSASGQITHWATSKTVDVVAGEAAQSYPDTLTRWGRRIIFLKPNVIVIHDVLDATAPSTFQWMLHAPHHSFEIGDNQVLWSGEPGTVRVRFLEPAGLRISQSDKFDTPLADWVTWKQEQYHLTADAFEPTAHREFLTLTTIDDVSVAFEKQSSKGVTTLTLAMPDSKAELTLEPKRFKVSTKGFRRSFADE